MPSHTRSERAKKPAKKNNSFAGITKGGLRNSLRKRFDVKLPKGTNIPKKLVAKAKALPKKPKNKLIKQQANLAQVFAGFKKKK